MKFFGKRVVQKKLNQGACIGSIDTRADSSPYVFIQKKIYEENVNRHGRTSYIPQARVLIFFAITILAAICVKPFWRIHLALKHVWEREQRNIFKN
jgi:hypothetical protein